MSHSDLVKQHEVLRRLRHALACYDKRIGFARKCTADTGELLRKRETLKKFRREFVQRELNKGER